MGVSAQAAEGTHPLYVCVHVPEFPAQALVRLRPELAGGPVVVLAGEPPFEQVCSLNTQAARLGVAAGMTRAELDCFPGLRALRQTPAEERGARAALLEAAGAFTPRLEVQPCPGSGLTVVLDMTGTGLIFGPARKAVEAILRALTALRFHVQIAASANLRTAVCVAPCARRAPVLVPAGQEAEGLRGLPLSALGPSTQHAETLAQWGLHRVGELAALPEEELVVRLGQEGRRLRLLARGEHTHLMVPAEPGFALEEFLAFDAPVEQLESLLFVIGPMLDQLLARAAGRALALAAVTLTLGLDGAVPDTDASATQPVQQHIRHIKPALPVLERAVLLKLLQLDLDAHPPPAGVLSIGLKAEPGPRSKVQMGLFSPQMPEPLRLDVTLARITALVGEDRIGRVRLLDAHRPDSFAMERFLVPSTKPQTGPHTGPHKAERSRAVTALRRCRPPVPLTVEFEALRLTSFSLRGRRFAVEQALGPWRRSGDWWSSGVWSREEWDVCAACSNGESLLCLLTHDLLQQDWQLEALYD